MTVTNRPVLSSEVYSRLRDQWSSPPWPDRRYWGTSRRAQQEAAAVADLVGGPATEPLPPRRQTEE